MNMNFDFNNPTKILFGSGKLNELGSQPLPGKKALLLMSGGKSAKVSGAYDRTLEQLRKAGVEVTEFAKVMENPVKEMVMEGAAFAKENGCDFIVALGGGAVLDSAVASLFQRAPFVLLNALWLDSAAKEGKNTLKKNLSFHASCYFSLYVLRLH